MNRTPETQADNLIDATLATLRTTAPPTGLEERLLKALESSQMRVPHVSNLRHGWTAPIVSPHLWLPTGLAVATFAIVFAIHRHHSTPAQTPTVITAAVEAPTTAPSPHELVILSHRRRTCCFTRHNLQIEATAPNPTTLDDQALEDALAPSHPAPPLPLTRQERLLLRFTRRGQLIQVAELDLTHEQEIRATTANRDAASLQQYVKGLLHTLVGFQPSEPAPSTEEDPPAPNPAEQAEQPTSSY